ncbi:endonuclease/exonuclease/phosphatase family protein [Streptomyces nanhaiensis]|uniref:endonuclease/exonuclease/phosphatase family protein n=1 Tax=Streptomyces nanhaiensis TaxID=679319 RepID=UPI00399C4D6C
MARTAGARRWRGADATGRTAWSRGRVPAALAVLTAGATAFHPLVPGAVLGLGSLLEAFLPWLGLAVPVLLAAALVRRSALALAALALPSAVWLALFHGALAPRGGDAAGATAGAGLLTAVQHNASDENRDPAATARALAAAGPDVVALQELTPAALPAYGEALAREYPHHAVAGTVGLWSRHPLTGTRPLDIRPADLGPDWNRGLRTAVRTPHGDVAVHVAHLPSVRIRANGFDTRRRDESAALLGEALRTEELPRVIVLGDFNATLDDRGLAPVLNGVDSTGREAADGFSFSWPTAFPVARIDHVMARGAAVTRLWTLPATGSDHLPVAARIALTPERVHPGPRPSGPGYDRRGR